MNHVEHNIFISFNILPPPKEVHADALYRIRTHYSIVTLLYSIEYLLMEWENSIMRLCAKLSGMFESNAPYTVLKRFVLAHVYTHMNFFAMVY